DTVYLDARCRLPATVSSGGRLSHATTNHDAGFTAAVSLADAPPRSPAMPRSASHGRQGGEPSPSDRIRSRPNVLRPAPSPVLHRRRRRRRRRRPPAAAYAYPRSRARTFGSALAAIMLVNVVGYCIYSLGESLQVSFLPVSRILLHIFRFFAL
ncbi:hypothetical protein DBV15_09643, partial [Temnothorax longispinosus]